MNIFTSRFSALVASSLLIAAAAHAAVTETFKQNYPLNATGAIRLDNVNGNIEITTWDKAEVALEAVKSAKDEEKLKRISVEIDTQPGTLSIKTKYAKPTGLKFNNVEGSVTYKLTVPAGATLEKIDAVNSEVTIAGVKGRVNVDVVNGRINASDLGGTTKLESVNGTINVAFASLENVQTVDLESVNGRVTVALPKGANASIDAETVNGRVNVDQAIKLSKSGRRSLRGDLGSGGPKFEIETVNGSISITETK
ncbi:DUF4097 family beta strand repeat-containing protein [Oleiharenicola lentus]|uniref:DUF4097 family beta strand repeat-containing protein n=1 Tax=Oleiharenicola lentus TaxID=2508720 RepID=UPI003F66AAC6